MAHAELSENVLSAQREAECEHSNIYDTIDIDFNDDEQAPALALPKLLQLPQADLISRTQDMKARNQQLDLLLLKAESYSHFISENQKRSRLTLASKSNNHERPSSTSSSTSTISSSSAVSSSSAKTSKKRKSPSKDGDSVSDLKANLEHALPKKALKKQSPGVDMASKTMELEEEPSLPAFMQPKSLVGGQLMPYQLEGLQWLLSLWENGLSGILADEMGLGKTIQIIALIAHLRDHRTPGPYLIAGPLATLPNWINEFRKWVPSCPVILYHGTKHEREQIRHNHMPLSKHKDLDFPVVITSFEMLMIDRPHLEKYTWQYMILDEGHRIKNRNCRLFKELKSIKSISRILLSGTPIQNTLEELWSLLNFCSPMIFDNLEVFQAWFGFRNIGKDTQVDDIIGTEQKERIVSKLHEILRPFLLRRLKKDVMINMPPKKEIVIYCGMSSLQREYYACVENGTIRDVLVTIGVEGAKETSQMNMLMNLRKVSNHPFLFGEPRDPVSGKYWGEAMPDLVVMASGKFKLLNRMLPVLKAGKHKVLIFSQMTQLLNILEDYAIGKEYKYCRLDGSTKLVDRQRAIDAFNKDASIFIFFLSTRAGGLGINLTGADTVIIFDSDWNPHQDSQAQDRCHRIGQTRPVVTYRLLTACSVDIQMMEKQVSKKKLERLTIQGGDFRKAGERFSSHLTIGSLRQLLEDDVKNLNRMTSLREMNALKTDSAVFKDISEEELGLVMDRDKVFSVLYSGDDDDQSSSSSSSSSSTSSSTSSNKYTCLVPLEGEMYDIVSADQAGILQALH